MKTTIIISALILLSTTVFSQDLRHSTGNKGLDLTYHFVKPGSAFSLGYIQYINQALLIKGKLNYETGTIDEFLETKIYQFLPSVGYSVPILAPVLYATGEVGGLIGKENYFNTQFEGEVNNVIYGGFYGLELEVFVNNNIAFLINTQQLYAKGSELSPHRFQIGFGVRLIIQ